MRSPALHASADISFNRLRNQVHLSDDPFQVAALYPWLSKNERFDLEPVIFDHARYPRMFAQAPYTPAALLDRLACENDDLILNKLARNPQTPLSVLERLTLCDDLPRQIAIARHPQASSDLLETFDCGVSLKMRHALCFNPNTGLSQLNWLLPGSSLMECKAIAQNRQVDGVLLSNLWQKHNDIYLRAEIVANSKCPRHLLELAVSSTNPLLRRKVAANQKLPKADRNQLLSDNNASVRVAALRHIGNGNLQLVNETASRVKRELARKAGLDEPLMKKLAGDNDKWVRRWIARNPATTESLLIILARDIQTEVRRGVARNPLLPNTLCKQLAGDVDSWVRAGISIRPDLNDKMIDQLANDKAIDVLSGLGRNPNSSEALLSRIAGHKHRDVRRAVILNLHCPLTVLRGLLEDPYALNRAMLCRHPNIGSTELMQLVDDPEPQVRFSAVQALAVAASDSPVIVNHD